MATSPRTGPPRCAMRSAGPTSPATACLLARHEPDRTRVMKLKGKLRDVAPRIIEALDAVLPNALASTPDPADVAAPVRGRFEALPRTTCRCSTRVAAR